MLKNLLANAGDIGDMGLTSATLGWGDPLEGDSNTLLYSCLGNPKDSGAWWARVHGIARVGHDLGTKPPSPPCQYHANTCSKKLASFSFDTHFHMSVALLSQLILISGLFWWLSGKESPCQSGDLAWIPG